MNYLKDHQIAAMVNQVRNDLSHICDYGCLREVISRSINSYLESNNLKQKRKVS